MLLSNVLPVIMLLLFTAIAPPWPNLFIAVLELNTLDVIMFAFLAEIAPPVTAALPVKVFLLIVLLESAQTAPPVVA